MQKRQSDRAMYFRELAATSRKYFIPYISEYKEIKSGLHVLEIGCGDGGNLLPFSELGCKVTGVDMAEHRINDAVRFFAGEKAKGDFIASDIFNLSGRKYKFDIIICHDVFEHIVDKEAFLYNLRRYANDNGIVFMSFPPWQMPFGGHQQICRSNILSHLPFVHLLPGLLYAPVLRIFGENDNCIRIMSEIKQTRISIERFEKLARNEKIRIINREFYFINPHYEIKFGLKPRKLSFIIRMIPYLRNFFTTSCFYILKF